MKILIAAVVLLAAVPAYAHHSFAAEFDSTACRDFTGTLTKIDWQNPHGYFYMDVKDANGKVESWSFQTYALITLKRAGIERQFFVENIGKEFWVRGCLAKVTGIRANISRDGIAKTFKDVSVRLRHSIAGANEVMFFEWAGQEPVPHGFALQPLSLRLLANAAMAYEADSDTLNYLLRGAQRLACFAPQLCGGDALLRSYETASIRVHDYGAE